MDIHLESSLVPNKSLFNVDTEQQLVKLLDDAWANRGSHTVNPVSGNWVYDIRMPNAVGTNGEQSVRIVVRPGTTDVVTAHPIP